MSFPTTLKIVWLAISTCFLLVNGFTQVSIQAIASTDKVELGETFELIYRVEGTSVDNLILPKVEGIDIGSRTGFSKNIVQFNGKVKGHVELVYPATPQKTGTIVIPPAKAIIAGKPVLSNPLTIKVGNKKPKPRFEADGDVFFKAVLSEEQIYLGQQATLRYEIYTTKNVINANFENKPTFNHVFSKPIDVKPVGKNIVINRKQYYTQPIETLVLYAQKNGKHKLEKATIHYKYEIANPQNPFFNEVVTKRLTTNELFLEVLELPKSGVPVTFSGGVGDFSFSTQVDKQTITTQEVIRVTMKIKGDGDPKFWGAPKWEFMDGLEFYDPNLLQEETTIENGREYHTKIYEYIIQPKHPSDLLLQPKFTYFSPDSHQYVTLEDKPSKIKILLGKNNAVNEPQAENNEPDFQERNKLIMPGIAILSALLAGTLGFFVYFKKRNARSFPKPSVDAEKQSIIILDKAKQFEKRGEIKAFFETVLQALFVYSKEKLHMNAEVFDKIEMITLFQSNQVPQELIDQFEKLCTTCELALFAGQKPETNFLVESAMEWITKMEKQTGHHSDAITKDEQSAAHSQAKTP